MSASAVLSENTIQDAVNKLKERVLADDTTKYFRSDENYLRRFLYSTDFNIDAAFTRLQAFSNLLLENPEWFASTSPIDKKESISRNVKVMLKERDKHGRRIFLYRFGSIDASKSSFQQEAQLDEIWFELVAEEPETQAKGISILIDMNNYSLKLFKWFTPLNLKVGSAKADFFPSKEMIYHVVNTSMLVNASIKLVWPFLPKRIKQSVKFHFSGWKSLHKYIDPEILPAEYGGTGPEIDFEKLNQWLYDQSNEIESRLRCQKIIQAFSKLLLENPDWFASTSPLEKKEKIDRNVKVILKERDKHGRRIYLYRLGQIDASKSSPQQEAQLDELWFELVAEEPETQAKGISVILDTNNYSLKLFKWLTPTNLRVGAAKADLFPSKEIIFHLVNTSMLVNASIKLAWPFLSERIKKMVKFHFSGWESLHEYIDPENLPAEYGGTGPEIDFEKLNQWLYDQGHEIESRLKCQKIFKK